MLKKLDGYPVIREQLEEEKEESSATLDINEIQNMADKLSGNQVSWHDFILEVMNAIKKPFGTREGMRKETMKMRKTKMIQMTKTMMKRMLIRTRDFQLMNLGTSIKCCSSSLSNLNCCMILDFRGHQVRASVTTDDQESNGDDDDDD